MELKQQRRDWEDLAHIDPMWAILSAPDKRDGGWNEREFFDDGEAEVQGLLARADAFGLPRRRSVALDFGCGIGRVSRPLAARFERCIGVDISSEMIAEACRRNEDVAGLEFIVNDSERIPAVADAGVDLVYSRIVLQHVSSNAAIRSYLTEFARVLAEGGLLVFQLPSYIPRRHRLQPRPRAYRLLRSLGIPSRLLYRRLHLQPIRMRALDVHSVSTLLQERGLRLIDLETERTNDIDSTTYYLTRG